MKYRVIGQTSKILTVMGAGSLSVEEGIYKYGKKDNYKEPQGAGLD